MDGGAFSHLFAPRGYYGDLEKNMVDVLSLGAVSTISFCYDLCRLIKGFFPTLKDAGGLFLHTMLTLLK